MSTKLLFRVAAVCVVSLGFAACTEETVPGGPTEPGSPTPDVSIAMVPTADTIGVDGTTQLATAVTGSTNTTVTFRSSAEAVATVNATGLVRGVAAGAATITAVAAADTTKRVTAAITVLASAPPPKPPTVSIALSPPTGSIAVGGTLQMATAVSGSSNTGVTYRTSAASIASVTGDGVVHGVAAGTATITAVADADTTKRATSMITVTESSPPPSAPSATYTAIAIGSLNGATTTKPIALNDSAQVVGSSGSNGFFWDSGVITNLTGPGDLSSIATTISNKGTVAGAFKTPETGGATVRFYTWWGGVKTDLGILRTGYDKGNVVALSEADEPVAYVDADDDEWMSAIWRGGVMQELGDLPGGPESAKAAAMNGRRQVVGSGYIRKSGTPAYWLTHAFLWQDGQTRDLGVLADPDCLDSQDQPAHCGAARASDINDNGNVVGSSGNAQGEGRAVLWAGGGSIQDIGPGAASQINGAGEIVGVGSSEPHEHVTSFYWHGGSRSNLPTLGGTATYIAELSEDGTVVGNSTTASGKHHAFVWHPGDAALTDLGLGPSGTGDDESYAVAVNALGDIIGYTATACSTPSCPAHAVIWKHKR